jgi:hypothetical protein
VLLVELGERFRAAVEAALTASGGDVRLLPQLITTACVEVLPIAGAGISITDDLRVPLGSSDAVAASAERLQTTLGEGPCLVAAGLPRPVAASWSAIAERWPIFAHELVDITPYRSVASLPLPTPAGAPLGAIDLYLTKPEPISLAALYAAHDSIAVPSAALLVGKASDCLSGSAGATPWLSCEAAEARLTVWTAVGMLLARTALDNADALALLRSFAYTEGITLDVAAARLVRREIDPAAVIDPRPGADRRP